jgi:hypothetical protein
LEILKDAVSQRHILWAYRGVERRGQSEKRFRKGMQKRMTTSSLCLESR